MADRVLRGSRLGAVSYETDRNHDLAPRQSMRSPARADTSSSYRSRTTPRSRPPGSVACTAASPGWSTAHRPSRRRSSPRARTGTCSWSVARSRTWRCCSTSASSCSPSVAPRSPERARGAATRVAEGPDRLRAGANSRAKDSDEGRTTGPALRSPVRCRCHRRRAACAAGTSAAPRPTRVTFHSASATIARLILLTAELALGERDRHLEDPEPGLHAPARPGRSGSSSPARRPRRALMASSTWRRNAR